MITKVNLRAYGILMNKQRQVLVSDEIVYLTGLPVTKLPGGGMELGEGLKDCLIREFKEELNIDIEVGEHIYTTDFFQQSAFNENDQLITVYYLVGTNAVLNFPVSNQPNYPADSNAENHRWIAWEDLNSDCVDLPIDKIAIDKLLFYLG